MLGNPPATMRKPMSPDIEIQLLRTFVEVVDNHGITAAAKKLGLSQPAVSQQLDRLGRLVDYPLFEPGTRRRALTQHGERLLERSRTLVRLHADLMEEVREPELAGVVVVGTPDLYAEYLLPDILADFSTAFPKVRITLRCSLSRTLMDAVTRNEVDIALMTRISGITDGEIVRKEPLVWITNTKLRAHERRPLPLAMLPPGNLYRDLALATLERHRIPWIETSVSENVAGLRAAVLSGLGVTVLGAAVLRQRNGVLAEAGRLPKLPSVELVLRQGSTPNSSAITRLASFMRRRLTSCTVP